MKSPCVSQVKNQPKKIIRFNEINKFLNTMQNKKEKNMDPITVNSSQLHLELDYSSFDGCGNYGDK